MYRLSVLSILAVALGLVLVAPLEAQAQQAVTQAVVIDTNGQNDKVLAEAKNAAAIFERLGIDARRRYLQATLAGDQSGSLVITIDYPSLKALAEAQEKLSGDKAWQDYVTKLTGMDISIVSNSLWVDQTP